MILERAHNSKERKKALTRGPFMCVVQSTWVRSKIKFLMQVADMTSFLNEKSRARS